MRNVNVATYSLKKMLGIKTPWHLSLFGSWMKEESSNEPVKNTSRITYSEVFINFTEQIFAYIKREKIDLTLHLRCLMMSIRQLSRCAGLRKNWPALSEALPNLIGPSQLLTRIALRHRRSFLILTYWYYWKMSELWYFFKVPTAWVLVIFLFILYYYFPMLFCSHGLICTALPLFRFNLWLYHTVCERVH